MGVVRGFEQHQKLKADKMTMLEWTDGMLLPIVMVVGAGRGPLVLASLRASQRALIPIRIYAVEKNPNAVITLRHMKDTLTMESEGVHIIASDMRTWDAPEKADILVSELLGSFGDNELSPECLDGAQKFLKDNGISIPCQSTSFIAPILSSKLWSEVARQPGPHPYESTYVVRMKNFKQIAKAQSCFTFNHPNFINQDNRRWKRLQFHVKEETMIHGFAGYFEAPLYSRSGKETSSWSNRFILKKEDCSAFISINPATFSEGMFSWFALYFPLRQPFLAKKGDDIELHIWRCSDDRKVWYEWTIVNPIISKIHNTNGRGIHIAR
eukprot:g5087.t1